MSHARPTLHMLCGKAGSGKSTLSTRLVADGAVLIAQDHWMSHLYPHELQTVEDYLRYMPRLRAAMAPHLVDLLRAGVSIVLDWPANTAESRAWMRGIFEKADAAHRLHYLEVPDDVCLARLAHRNASGDHAYQVSRAVFRQLTRLFEPPQPAEGFDVTVYPCPT